MPTSTMPTYTIHTSTMSPARLSRTKPIFALTAEQLTELKHLRWSIAKYDYETFRPIAQAWGLPLNLMGWLMHDWCFDMSVLGEGAFSYALQHHDFPNLVIKVGVGGTFCSFNPEEAALRQGHLSDSWLAFGLYSAMRPEDPRLPGIAFIGVYDCCYIAVVELLKDASHQRTDEHSRALYQATDRHPENSSGLMTHEEFNSWVGTLRELHTACPGSWDLHTGNIRYRANGQLVLIDPLAGSVPIERTHELAKECALCEWVTPTGLAAPQYNPYKVYIKESIPHAEHNPEHNPEHKPNHKPAFDERFHNVAASVLPARPAFNEKRMRGLGGPFAWILDDLAAKIDAHEQAEARRAASVGATTAEVRRICGQQEARAQAQFEKAMFFAA